MIAATCATVRDLYDQFYRPIRLRSRSENTRRLYEFSMARFDEFLGRRALLTDFDDATVCRFLEWRRASGVAPSTVERDRYNLLALWRYANRRKLVDTWPEIEPEVIPERAVMAWTETEIHTLVDACKLAEGKIGWSPGLMVPSWLGRTRRRTSGNGTRVCSKRRVCRPGEPASFTAYAARLPVTTKPRAETPRNYLATRPERSRNDTLTSESLPRPARSGSFFAPDRPPPPPSTGDRCRSGSGALELRIYFHLRVTRAQRRRNQKVTARVTASVPDSCNTRLLLPATGYHASYRATSAQQLERSRRAHFALKNVRCSSARS